jgi:hypothetical protein
MYFVVRSVNMNMLDVLNKNRIISHPVRERCQDFPLPRQSNARYVLAIAAPLPNHALCAQTESQVLRSVRILPLLSFSGECK